MSSAFLRCREATDKELGRRIGVSPQSVQRIRKAMFFKNGFSLDAEASNADAAVCLCI